ncbi:MAG: MFS transporter [Firmicutes bacterium]|nr:MFS transporter [Bacillota bacterium]
MGQRLHYAWVSLGAAWLGFLSFGLIRSIYPYAVPAMQDSLQISHATMAAVISCFFWVDMVMRISWGAVTDRLGSRLVTLLGSALLATGFFLMSTAKRVLYLSLGFAIAGAGAAALFILPTPLLSRWFGQRRRSLALGIATTAAPLVTVLAGFIVPRILAVRPYNSIWLYTGFIVLFIFFFELAFLVNSPGEKGLTPYGGANGETAQPAALGAGNPWGRARVKGILANGIFHRIGGAYFLFGCAYTGINTFLLGYLQEVGLSTVGASQLLAFTGMGNLLGSPLWGFLGGRFARRNIFTAGMLVLALGISLLILANQIYPLNYLAAIMYGVGAAGAIVMISAIQADYFEKNILGTSFGFCAACFSIASALSPIVGGAIADYTGSLQAVMFLGLLASLGSAATIHSLSLPQRVGDKGTNP